MSQGSTLVDIYRAEGVRRVKVGFTDIDGVMRGKYLSLEKFAAIADGTSGFCDCVFGWDVDDQLYDNASYTGWHTAFPDATYRIDLSSERRLADEENIPLFLADFVGEGEYHPICPRNQLKRMVDGARSAGFASRMAFEYEFFVFKETPASAAAKHYRDLEPLTPGNFGYSLLRTFSLSDLFNELMDHCANHGINLEGLHCETGPGVWEAAITVDDALAAADQAALFKVLTKSFFQKRGMIATFMAKWSMDYPGQSGHLHQSLVTTDGLQSVFFDDQDPSGMSDLMRHYVAGIQTHLPALLAMTAPTINSYTRLVKGAWAPTASTWGIENRTTALRVIEGSAKSQRVEFRVGAADANPYLTAAATLGAGLLGIAAKLPLVEAIQGNAYEVQDALPSAQQLPANLLDATRAFEVSDAAIELFGQVFVEHFAASRKWEVREYERHLNDWQLKRYFEII